MSLAAFAGFAPPQRAAAEAGLGGTRGTADTLTATGGFDGSGTPEKLDALPRRVLVSEQEKQDFRAEARGARDAERRLRFLDAKQRTIGVDKQALDLQVAEKEQQYALASDQDRAQDAQAASFARQIDLRERAGAAARRAMERQCMEFNRLFLEPSGPPRRAPEEPDRPDGTMKFAGEDLNQQVRQWRQRQQQKAWVEQQVFEKSVRQEEQLAVEKHWTEQVQHVAEAMRSVEESDKARRQAVERARFQYNLAAAQTKRGEAQAARTAQREEERAEMRFHDQDPFLNEDQRRFGSVVPRAERKGAAASAELAVVGANARSIAAKRAAEAQAERAETARSAQDAAVRRQLVLSQREAVRLRAEREREVQRQNMVIAAAQRQRRDYEKTFITRGAVTDEYFQQYGRSDR